MTVLSKLRAVKRRLARRSAATLPKQPRGFVVGAPRSGFTLLISVLNRLLGRQRFRSEPKRKELRACISQATVEIRHEIEAFFKKHGQLDDLIISPEFELLVGGPKWISKEDSQVACVRKYVGIRRTGDFLAVFSVPKVALDYYPIVHSHYQPAQWLCDAYYEGYLKFASFRNPLDVLNSATFSINALTGEYIHRYIDQDPNQIRENLALYKMTDLNFIEGLIAPQVEYWKEFLPIRDQYFLMRWEELITDPAKTICSLAERLGVSVSATEAEEIWRGMRNKNQTAHHDFNFRKGVIGDWRNHLVNEHLDILKQHGFDEFLQALGYHRIQYLDRAEYTPYQRKVEECIRKGTVFQWQGDADLFTFAFNKSNFKSAKYDFIDYKGSGPVEVERSSIRDEAYLKEFTEVVGRCVEHVNDSLRVIERRYSEG